MQVLNPQRNIFANHHHHLSVLPVASQDPGLGVRFSTSPPPLKHRPRYTAIQKEIHNSSYS